jgi:peptidoglycan/xylan/chitin deacetylase (PgdA/CDA1 family)
MLRWSSFVFSLVLVLLVSLGGAGCKRTTPQPAVHNPESKALEHLYVGPNPEVIENAYAGDRYQVPPDHVFMFDGVRGPTEPTVLPAKQPVQWATYDRGGESRLAILLTDPNSGWLGLVHGLKTIGVPFRLTTDWQQALRHRVVMVYPIISGKVLPTEALQALAAHPREGGTLIGFNVLGGGLEETFGFGNAVPSREREELRFTDMTRELVAFTDERERVFRLADKSQPDRALGLYAYSQPLRPPLAVYNDGAAAITQKFFATGRAYAFGIDAGAFIIQGQHTRHEWLGRAYANEFEPPIDVLLRLLKAIYVTGEPNAVVVRTVPEGKSLLVSITHDVDYSRSLRNALEYAQYESEQGIPATYFIQAKYIRDFNDEIFFNDREVPLLKEIAQRGMELGSHTIAHSRVFNHFPLGNGREQYPNYQPYVMERMKAYNGSVLGELRVSKFLVERFSDQPVISFRPGELSYPLQLPEALWATGYRYSSSVTSGTVLTHLPFQARYSQEWDSEVPIFEFPITIEDELPPRMDQRLPQAIALAQKLRQYGGSFVILIHPNIVDYKLEFEKQFVNAVREFSWFCAIGQCGKWWAARNTVELDVRHEAEQRIVNLQLPERLSGLTLEVPQGWKLVESSITDTKVAHKGEWIVLPGAHGTVRLTFRATPDQAPQTVVRR